MIADQDKSLTEIDGYTKQVKAYSSFPGLLYHFEQMMHKKMKK